MKMKVDCGQKTISFAVNGENFKQCANIAPSKTAYYLAVTMWHKDDRVSIVRYSGPEEESKEPEVKVLSYSLNFILCETFSALQTTTEFGTRIRGHCNQRGAG